LLTQQNKQNTPAKVITATYTLQDKTCLQSHFWFVDTETDRQTDPMKTIPAFAIAILIEYTQMIMA